MGRAQRRAQEKYVKSKLSQDQYEKLVSEINYEYISSEVNHSIRMELLMQKQNQC